MDEPSYATWTITKRVVLEPLPELTPEQEALMAEMAKAMFRRVERSPLVTTAPEPYVAYSAEPRPTWWAWHDEAVKPAFGLILNCI